ncbi:GLPGLI family protein [Flavobacterium dauae]|uniref:GLPGLI family protein n=1 Tax=Flavobacterium dauae TaxID=1563479 RepID=UPI0013EC2649|nr:GLPGLI family protein [Flavobacterium dauae]WLD23149.1 GLPGLI family protein [Flavobacterium dauae]
MLAQTNDYKITYKRFEGNHKRDAVLYVKENQPTVMQTIMASTVPIKVLKDTTYINENGATVMKGFSGSTDYSKFPDEYIKVDHLQNKIEMIKDIHKKNFLVTDELNYTWQITNETKKIKDYTCYKATTTFRGNTFEAWFTPDIPINAGPWKWYGLPGLIVEATDKDQSVVFKLEKIEKLTEEIPFPSSKSKKMTLKQYFKEADEAFEAMFASNDRNTTTTVKTLGRFGLERVYEWEEEPKK